MQNCYFSSRLLFIAFDDAKVMIRFFSANKIFIFFYRIGCFFFFESDVPIDRRVKDMYNLLIDYDLWCDTPLFAD